MKISKILNELQILLELRLQKEVFYNLKSIFTTTTNLLRTFNFLWPFFI